MVFLPLNCILVAMDVRHEKGKSVFPFSLSSTFWVFVKKKRKRKYETFGTIEKANLFINCLLPFWSQSFKIDVVLKKTMLAVIFMIVHYFKFDHSNKVVSSQLKERTVKELRE